MAWSGGLGTDEVDGGGEIDVEVVPLGRLGRGREHRLVELARQLQPLRHGHAVHGARLLVLLPRLAGQVAPDDALELEHLGAAHERRPAGPRRRHGETAQLRLDVRGVDGQDGAGHDVGHLLAPEPRHRREHAALVGDRLGHDDVERAHPVRGDHEQAVFAGVVELADLARVHPRQRGGVGAHSATSASAKRST